MNLTAKQTRFCQEYLVDLNGTQAAIRAGYSKKTASVIGSQNLSKLNIQVAIQRHQAEQQARTEVSADDVIRGLSDIAVNGNSESVRVRAFELLGKHFGSFTDRIELADQKPEPQFIFYWPENGRDLPETIEALHSRL